MKTLFACVLIALTFRTASVALADGPKDAVEAKSSFQSAVYPVANSLKVSVTVTKPKESSVNVRLLNQAGETLTVLKLGKDNESSTIRFDLSDLEDGTYRVEISNGFKTAVKTVTLQTSPPIASAYRAVSLN